jgi:Protein of unknown function (DUF1572)
MAIDNNLLDSAKKQFEYYKMLGDKTFVQLTDEQLFKAPSAESNSIATIIIHLHGNMLSRWTDFLTTDGEKAWRQRDAEFEHAITDRTDLLAKWDAGWACLFYALNQLTKDDLAKVIFIRNQSQTVTEAVHRQLAHYPYHIGQIVFIGKLLSNENWTSLSIPKGTSVAYNTEKFAAPNANKKE